MVFKKMGKTVLDGKGKCGCLLTFSDPNCAGEIKAKVGVQSAFVYKTKFDKNSSMPEFYHFILEGFVVLILDSKAICK